MIPEKFDYIVIGGGSGGIASTKWALNYGARVALIEADRLGGTCVNVGCVPKKVMWNASRLNELMILSGSYGFSYEALDFDWSKLKQDRDQYIARLNNTYANSLEQAGAHIYKGWGHFIDQHTVAIDQVNIKADHILIATGGRPVTPSIEGAELGITSDDFFALERMPPRCLIIGAGYIATELAGLLNGLGSTVTVLLRKQQLLRKFDASLSQAVMDEMRHQNITFVTDVQLNALFRDKNGCIGVRYADTTQLTGFDCIIWAVGRIPNLAHLELEKTGLKLDSEGFISTDKYQNTTVTGIYAVGDVTNREQLTPVAIGAGRKLADRLFGGQADAHLDYHNIPTVIFSHPPIGTIGLTEAAAREKYGPDKLKIYTKKFSNMLFALKQKKSPTLIKLITIGVEEKIIGCHIIGEACDEIMQGFAVAIKMGACKSDFDQTIAIHPTAAEELVTM